MNDIRGAYVEKFEHDLLDDEIDYLYSQLEPVAPPPTLVGNIMASVARLSQTQENDLRVSDGEESKDSLLSWNNLSVLLGPEIGLKLS
jgi:hypothetical protein